VDCNHVVSDGDQWLGFANTHNNEHSDSINAEAGKPQGQSPITISSAS
jgi:hypothetical protein